MTNIVKLSGTIQGIGRSNAPLKLYESEKCKLVSFKIKHDRIFVEMIAFDNEAVKIVRANAGAEIEIEGKYQVQKDKRTNEWKPQIKIDKIVSINMANPIEETKEEKEDLPW